MTKELRNRIETQLKWDSRIDDSNIEVEIKDKKVILKGQVPNILARTASTVTAYSVAGGYQVENNLEVAYPKDFKIPSDDEIAGSIRTSLSAYRTIDESDVDIAVEKGNVKLKGSVDAFWKKQRAEHIASTITGVKTVQNLLAVTPTEDVVDERIAETVTEALDRDARVNADNVDVEVKDGIVTLRGDVHDWTSYAAALYCAANTVAVKNVMSDIKVQGGIVDSLKTLFEM